jgi:hypothetical protein
MRTVPSSLPDTSNLPSAENTTALTVSLWPSSLRTTLLVAVSQTQMRAEEGAATNLPSVE